MWIFHNFTEKLFDTFFPKKCIGCKKENTIICKICLNNLRKNIDTENLLVYSYFSYKDLLTRKIIRNIKYFHRKDLINPLTSESFYYFSFVLSEIDNPIIIPIPVSKIRLYVRGYNQAELIAKEFSNFFKVDLYNNILIKNKTNKRQAIIRNKNERIENIKNSFAVKNKEEIFEKNIILIDDVATSYATMNEARNILLKNGAKKVIGFTLAH